MEGDSVPLTRRDSPPRSASPREGCRLGPVAAGRWHRLVVLFSISSFFFSIAAHVPSGFHVWSMVCLF